MIGLLLYSKITFNIVLCLITNNDLPSFIFVWNWVVNFIGNYEERGNELSLFKILMEGFIVCGDPKSDGNDPLGQQKKDFRVVWCGHRTCFLPSSDLELKGACLVPLVFRDPSLLFSVLKFIIFLPQLPISQAEITEVFFVLFCFAFEAGFWGPKQ